MNSRKPPVVGQVVEIRSSNVVRLICGPGEFRWRSIIARVEYILEYDNRLCVIVLANGVDPRHPNEQDTTNAELTAVVVSRQIRFRLSTKRLSVFLKYAGHTQCEVDVDIPKATKLVRNYLRNSRQTDEQWPLPTSVLGYLMNLCG